MTLEADATDNSDSKLPDSKLAGKFVANQRT